MSGVSSRRQRCSTQPIMSGSRHTRALPRSGSAAQVGHTRFSQRTGNHGPPQVLQRDSWLVPASPGASSIELPRP